MTATTTIDDAATDTGPYAGERLTSFFEFWPGWLFYAPVVLQWLWLGLRWGDLSLPTAANPHIETGGLCGESKTAILDQVAEPARAMLAPYVRIRADLPPILAEAAMRDAGLAFPVILKPDIGCNGTGVRLLADAADLARSLPEYPPQVDLVLQHYVTWEGETGVFYIRRPGEARGRITSITLKHAPYVVGDGVASLRELVLRDPRAGRLPRMYLPRLAGRLDSVPAAGERVRLVLVGNHCKGSIFRDGTDQATPALAERIEALAQSLPDFHFGRFDLRFRSLAALRRGEDFLAIEVNGAGSEATHIWDARTSLRRAWADQFAHYRAVFEIGRVNRARGFKTSGLRPMFRAWRRQVRLMGSYPAND
jgi:hypothetical protein